MNFLYFVGQATRGIYLLHLRDRFTSRNQKVINFIITINVPNFEQVFIDI